MFKALILGFSFMATGLLAENAPDCGLYAYRIDVARVIDGDTIVADIDLGFDVWLRNEHLRLFKIQTPEKGAKGYLSAKNALERRLTDGQVYICTVKKARSEVEKTGSFGRYLATLYVNGHNLNDWLVQEGFAVAYEH